MWPRQQLANKLIDSGSQKFSGEWWDTFFTYLHKEEAIYCFLKWKNFRFLNKSIYQLIQNKYPIAILDSFNNYCNNKKS